MSARRTNYLKGSSSLSNQSDDSQQYEVQKIINKKVQNNTKMYKVVWAGYDIKQATWEPQQNLSGCKHKIQEFQIYYQQVKRKQQEEQKKRQNNRKLNNLPNPQQIKRLIMNPTLNLQNQIKPQIKNIKHLQQLNRENPNMNSQQKQLTIPKMFSKPLKYSVEPILSVATQKFKDFSRQNQKNIQVKSNLVLNNVKDFNRQNSKNSQVQSNLLSTNANLADNKANLILNRIKLVPNEQDNISQQADKQEPQIFYLSQSYPLNAVQIVGIKNYCSQDKKNRIDHQFLIIRKKNTEKEYFIQKKRVQKQAPIILLEFYQSLLEK